jgi:hypothetical protein
MSHFIALRVAALIGLAKLGADAAQMTTRADAIVFSSDSIVDRACWQ